MSNKIGAHLLYREIGGLENGKWVLENGNWVLGTLDHGPGNCNLGAATGKGKWIAVDWMLWCSRTRTRSRTPTRVALRPTSEFVLCCVNYVIYVYIVGQSFGLLLLCDSDGEA